MGLLRLIFKPVGCLVYAVGALAVALALGLAALAWALHHYAVPLLRHALESQTGYSFACESARPALWVGDFEATKVRVFNPAVFGEPSFIECERLFVDADPLSALLSKTFLIHEVDVEISRLTIVFNRFGENNLSTFLESCAPEPKPPAEAPPAPRNVVLPRNTPASPAPTETQEDAPPRWREVPQAAAMPDTPPPWRIAKLRVAVKAVRVQLGAGPGMDFDFAYDRTFEQVTDMTVLLEQLRADLLRRALAFGRTKDGAPEKTGR